MTTTTRWAAALAAAALTTTLTACGGGSDLLWSGTDVADPAKSLESIETAWKQQLANSDVKVRTTDDSRCYFQVSQVDGKRSLGDQTLCGPYRSLGSEKTSWDVAPLAPISAEGDTVTIGLATGGDPGAKTFEEGKSQPNLVPWRPDDAKAQLDAVVDEPDAPKAAVGDVLKDVTAGPNDGLKDAEVVATPTGRYIVSFAPVDRIGTGEARRQAPDGGKILAYSIRTEDSPSGSQAPSDGSGGGGTTALSVKVGDKDYPLDITRGGAVAVNGDGKDASFAFTYDGLTQTVGSDGKRVGTKAAGYYLPVRSGTSPDLRVTIGGTDESTDGWHASSVLSEVQLDLVAYDAEKKWAPDGKVWARVKANFDDPDVIYRKSSWPYRYSTTPQLTKATLGGVDATTKSLSTGGWGTGGFQALFLLPADAEARSLKLQATVTANGPLSGSGDAGVPASTTTTFPFEGSISLQG